MPPIKTGFITPPWMQKADAEQDKSLPFVTVTVSPQPIDLSAPAPQGQFHRILIIGDSGTGKTHFLGTMPKPFVADFDRGLSTLRGQPVKALAFSPDAGWPDFKAEVLKWRQGAQYGCETFCLDSLTMAADAALTAVMKKNNRANGNPTVQDWGEAIREVKDVMGYLTTLPCHVVVTAHAQIVKDETLGDIQFLPLIYGKDLPHRLGIWFDEVYMTTVASELQGGTKVNKYKLQVKPDTRMKILKSRMNTHGELFSMHEDPNFATLVVKTAAPTAGPTPTPPNANG